jgi:hypothetical protein
VLPRDTKDLHKNIELNETNMMHVINFLSLFALLLNKEKASGK